jgi:hypothetical protein
VNVAAGERSFFAAGRSPRNEPHPCEAAAPAQGDEGLGPQAFRETFMTDAESNMAFIREMIGQKKRLEDFPGRYDPQLIMHEPASLPFGGTYHGLDEFQRFYPAVRAFYDFDRFELLGVYGDGDMVFATIKAAVAGSGKTIFIAEQCRFEKQTLVEVRVHICEAS